MHHRTPRNLPPAGTRAFEPAASLLLALIALPGLAADPASVPIPDPHPIAAPANFELHPDLELSLFAREPDVVDPVALTFDEFGVAYVVEMRDYPYGVGPDRRPGGTVRRLEDTDGDGRADRSVLFAEELSFPTSIAAWNGGVLVTAPPDILFLKDTDGDGQADVRETVVSGFRLAVTDSNANGLRYGLDNWFHGVNGGNGGSLSSPGRQAEPLRLGDHDFRLRPATGEIELTSHTGGGFGLVFDDWGRSFTPYNIDHIKQRVVDASVLRRFPGLPPIETTHSISDHGDMARIYPIATAVTRPNHPEQAGHFSAAGGMGFLAHRGWPGDLPGSVFVCDVVGNLVHRDLLVPNGPIQRATRPPGEQTREFFASRDLSFRPIGLEPGPDGALYLLDMQRDVIEHPDYIPRKLLDKLDIRAGADRGRIYRIAPRRWPKTRELPGHSAPADWVRMLGSANPWTRMTAQRLLVARRDPAVIPALRAMVRDGAAAAGSNADLARLHALWSLDGLDALDLDTLVLGLTDIAAPIRANALQMAGTRVRSSPKLGELADAMLSDPDAEVRFHAAIASGNRDWVRALDLVPLLKRDHGFPWTRRAVLSSLGPATHAVIGAVFGDRSFWRSVSDAKLDLAREIADVMAATRFVREEAVDAASKYWWCADGAMPAPSEFTLPLGQHLPDAVQVAMLDGAAQGLARRETPLSAVPDAWIRQLDYFIAPWPKPSLLRALLQLRHRLGQPPSETEAKQMAFWGGRVTNTALPVAERVEMVRLLGVAEFTTVGPTLFRLLNGSEPAAIQQAALEVLRDHREPQVGEGLIRSWPFLAPGLRPAVVNLLVYRNAFHPALLDALEGAALHVGALNLDLEHRRRLLRHAHPDIRSRAARFMSDEEYSNRGAAVDEWLARIPADGDADRGRIVFERLCATCHVVGGTGFAVGPELTGMSHRSVEDLVSNILDPNLAMNPAFVAYTAELDDGEAETGVLVAETESSVALAQAGGRRVEIPRNRIRTLKSDGRSLMPEGLEAGLTPQELRDLIALLQAPTSQQTGNEP